MNTGALNIEAPELLILFLFGLAIDALIG